VDLTPNQPALCPRRAALGYLAEHRRLRFLKRARELRIGRKVSKSAHSASEVIRLTDSPEMIQQKIRKAVTDSASKSLHLQIARDRKPFNHSCCVN